MHAVAACVATLAMLAVGFLAGTAVQPTSLKQQLWDTAAQAQSRPGAAPHAAEGPGVEAANARTSAVATATALAAQLPENDKALEQADSELASTRLPLETAQESTKAQADTAGASEQGRALEQERASTEAASQRDPASGRSGARSATLDRIIERAQELIALHDVNGARLLLERSLALGDERAALPLAQTYDPGVLAERGLRGVKGDALKARTLYLRASGNR